MFGAAVQHQYFLLVGIAALNVAIAAGYYLNVVRVMFFPPADVEEGIAPKPTSLPIALAVQLVLVICVAATLWLGIYPPNVIEWANVASQQLLSLHF